MLAVEDYPADDVEAAIDSFLKGTAPGVNASFLPPAPAVGAECRRQLHLRVDRENRERKLRPQLPPPDIVHTPEERARVQQKIDDLLANLAAAMETEDASLTRRKLGQFAKTNAKFAPDMSPAAVRRRLGFEVGDPEGAEDAA